MGARSKENQAPPSDTLQRWEVRAKAAERERDGLKAELEAARARIAYLEECSSQIVNRIDWVIDSLHTLSSKSA